MHAQKALQLKKWMSPVFRQAKYWQCLNSHHSDNPQLLAVFNILYYSWCYVFIGLLAAVGSLSLTVQGSVAILDWEEPFRLNNSDGSPDLTYCVELVNASYSEEPLIISRCGLSETEFNYTIPSQRWCYRYITLVTPINMAGRGVQETKFRFGDETRNKYYN